MTNCFFNLPSNILSTIYEMDTTYRNKIKEEINTEIIKKGLDNFRKKFIQKFSTEQRELGTGCSEIFRTNESSLRSSFRYRPQTIGDKFDVLLKLIFDKHMSGYENGEYENLCVDEIVIFSNYDNNLLYFKIYLSRTTSFEGWVYTTTQYNEKNSYSWYDRMKKNISFQNDFVIVFPEEFVL